MESIGKKIIEVRKQKGLTQEELSEMAKINLRTLQRIEKDETTPRGNTLKGICSSLSLNIEDLLDYGKTDDYKYLRYMHLSVMSFAIIPFGNIILPLIMWLNKRDKIIGLDEQGTNLINYQILWSLVTNILIITYAALKISYIGNTEIFLYAFFIMYIANFFYPIYIAVKINRGVIKIFYPAPLKIVK